MNSIIKVPESRIIAHLQNLTRLRGQIEVLQQCLEEIDALPHLDLPFQMGQVRVVPVAISVVGGVVNPTNRQPLLQFLGETPDQVCLFVDPNFDGNKSLFVALLTSQFEEPVRRWLGRMTYPQFYLNNRGSDYYLAAPLRAFIA